MSVNNKISNPESLSQCNEDGQTEGSTQSNIFFSAKPKVMNLENIYAPKDGCNFIPAPLSLKRNGYGSELNHERDDSVLGQGSSNCPD